jgi:glycosyltransferase involved in cell wall biosynthesis
MEKCRVGIVIPALNESATIADIVQVVGKYGVPIVVDDGSTDNTALLAVKSGAVVFTHEKNRGYDAALNSGFRKAAELGCQIIITVDADGQHDPLLIQQFINAIDSGADIVVGKRSSRLRIAEHLFAWYTGLRFGINDPLCGMKAYKTFVYEELGHFDSYGSVGTELMIFGAMRSYRVEQIEFNVRDRRGVSRFGNFFSGNYKIIRAFTMSLRSSRRILK